MRYLEQCRCAICGALPCYARCCICDRKYCREHFGADQRGGVCRACEATAAREGKGIPDGPKLRPGSDEALAVGCACPVLDNAHGKGYMGIAGSYVYNLECPVHGNHAAARLSKGE